MGKCDVSDLPTYTYRLKYATIAGYLPAPQTEPTRKDYAIMGTASDGTRVMIADCHHVDITPEPEPAPDLAASLFGASVVVADPEPEPEPEETPQTVMFTYKSGKVKHELRAGSTIVKVGKNYYNLNGRKITAIYTDDTCKRIVPERYYSRLFNVSEDPTLFA